MLHGRLQLAPWRRCQGSLRQITRVPNLVGHLNRRLGKTGVLEAQAGKVLKRQTPLATCPLHSKSSCRLPTPTMGDSALATMPEGGKRRGRGRREGAGGGVRGGLGGCCWWHGCYVLWAQGVCGSGVKGRDHEAPGMLEMSQPTAFLGRGLLASF